MISLTWVVGGAGLAWGFFLLYMAWGRDYTQQPLWVWLGLPATLGVILAVGHFYFGYPIFS
jgi:hypothetical protein